ncbi:hypothetical protein Tco_1560653, partial [Tanacetum coccineum]
MVKDTPLEEAAFMEIEGINDEQSIEEDYYSHHAFMFHPRPPTKIEDMVQSAGSWKQDKELPTQSKSWPSSRERKNYGSQKKVCLTEQIKFEEQKDEEIRKLKAQLQKEREKETE